MLRYTLALGNDDARQEAVLGLIDAVSHYDAKKLVSLTTFAFYRVLSRLARAYQFRAFVGRPDKGLVVYSVANEVGGILDLLPARPAAQDHREDIDSMLACLSPRERIVADLRLQEVSFRDIGRHMGTSKQRIQQIWNRCVHKIRHSFPQYHREASWA